MIGKSCPAGGGQRREVAVTPCQLYEIVCFLPLRVYSPGPCTPRNTQRGCLVLLIGFSISLTQRLTRGDVPMLNLPRSVARHQNVPRFALSDSRPESQRRGWERLHVHIPFRKRNTTDRNKQAVSSSTKTTTANG